MFIRNFQKNKNINYYCLQLMQDHILPQTTPNTFHLFPSHHATPTQNSHLVALHASPSGTYLLSSGASEFLDRTQNFASVKKIHNNSTQSINCMKQHKFMFPAIIHVQFNTYQYKITTIFSHSTILL